MNSVSHPVVYSYKRCPYAMRARLSIYFSGKAVEQREIVFWDKPEPMLVASPKGTVPVLILPDGSVIEESWEIMQWALAKHALYPDDLRINKWIRTCDVEFKPHLDDYKYPELCRERYPDLSPESGQVRARQGGEWFIQQLEKQLQQSEFLLGSRLSIADLAVFPFVRQFAHVDKSWWQDAPYPGVQKWLDGHTNSDYFAAVMKNRPVWEPKHQALWVDEPELQRKDQFRAKAEAKPIPG